MQVNVLWTGREYYSLENCLIHAADKGVHVNSVIVGKYEDKLYRVEYEIVMDQFWQTTFFEVKSSEFNGEITLRMLERARVHAEKVGAKISYVLHVPGTFDMPLAAERLLKKKNVDAVVTLGAVIKGDTRHDDIVAENAARLIADLSLKHGKPVALGITGPGMTIDQARERAQLVPVRAVNAAVNMVLRLRKLQKAASGGTVVINDTADNN
jgi:6,7-dimethyl-8-ribityllumazine synthase